MGLESKNSAIDNNVCTIISTQGFFLKIQLNGLESHVHMCVTVKAIIAQLQIICAIACFSPHCGCVAEADTAP